MTAKPFKVGDRVTVDSLDSGDHRHGWEGLVYNDPNPLRSGKWSSLDVDFGEAGVLRVSLFKLVAGGRSEFVPECWN